MSYFNELAGSPKNGWKQLSFSNIDWGQDTPDLYKWQQSHEYARPLFIDTKSLAKPHHFGIVEDPFPTLQQSDEMVFPPGWYVSGINEPLENNSRISGFLRLNPADRIGFSWNVYHLTSEQPLAPIFPWIRTSHCRQVITTNFAAYRWDRMTARDSPATA